MDRTAARTSHHALDRLSDGRGVSEVVGDIMQNVNSLARAEARLAVAETVTKVSGRARSAGRGATIAAAGGVLGILAIGGLLAAGAAALALVMAAWLAILLVAAVTALGAALAIFIGARHLRRALSPAHAPAPPGAKDDR